MNRARCFRFLLGDTTTSGRSIPLDAQQERGDNSIRTPTKSFSPRFARYYLPPILWVILIFSVSSIPNLGEKAPFEIPDKVAHFVEYAILGFLLFRALGRETRAQSSGLCLSKALLGAMGLGLGIGAVDELHQLFIPGRSCDLLDFACDALGVILLASIAFLWRRRTLHPD